jgi:hypothetical protein
MLYADAMNCIEINTTTTASHTHARTPDAQTKEKGAARRIAQTDPTASTPFQPQPRTPEKLGTRQIVPPKVHGIIPKPLRHVVKENAKCTEGKETRSQRCCKSRTEPPASPQQGLSRKTKCLFQLLPSPSMRKRQAHNFWYACMHVHREVRK